jgi:hypothetical protein
MPEQTPETPSGAPAPGELAAYPPPAGPPASAPQAYPGHPTYVVGGTGYPPGTVYVQPATPKTSPAAIIAVVLAVLSFLQCPVVLAVIALVLARSAEKDIAESNGWVTGEGLARGARIAAWINIGLSIAALVGFVIVLVVTAAMGSAGGAGA